MDTVMVSISSWNRFLTTNFYIVPELVGNNHHFMYKTLDVKIRLPSNEYLPMEPNDKGLLAFNSYREIDGKKVPINYSVEAVDIRIQIPEEINVPQGVLNRPPKAYDLLTEREQTQLNILSEKYGGIAEEVFRFWIRVLRWECNNSSIGQPTIVGHNSGWSTYLTNKETGADIWAEPSVFHVDKQEEVTLDMWENTQDALQKDLNPPVYIEFLFDGIEYTKNGDYLHAIVDMAVACETYLRTLIIQNLPFGINSEIVKYIDDANIRQVLTKFFPEILDENGKKSLKKIISKLHSLFDNRNDIMHSGKRFEITNQDCLNYIIAIQNLFLIKPSITTHIPSTEDIVKQ